MEVHELGNELRKYHKKVGFVSQRQLAECSDMEVIKAIATCTHCYSLGYDEAEIRKHVQEASSAGDFLNRVWPIPCCEDTSKTLSEPTEAEIRFSKEEILDRYEECLGPITEKSRVTELIHGEEVIVSPDSDEILDAFIAIAQTLAIRKSQFPTIDEVIDTTVNFLEVVTEIRSAHRRAEVRRREQRHDRRKKEQKVRRQNRRKS